MSDPKPVADPERIVFWDVLRGVAVLGVLLANMPLMSFGEGLTFDSYPMGPEKGAFDLVAFAFVRVFADTKFITIFSILFGAGLGIMSEKAIAADDRPFAGLYLRRLALLALIGLMHAHLVWFGDILLHYALVGTAALLFRRLSVKTLVTCALSLLVFCFAFNLLSTLAMNDPEFKMDAGTPEEQAAHYDVVYASGDFIKIVSERSPFALIGMIFMGVFWGLRTLGLFLIGIALVKSGIFVNAESRRGLFRKVALVGLVIGVPLSVAFHLAAEPATAFGGNVPTDAAILTNTALSYLNALALSPAYIAIIALWTMSSFMVAFRARLAAVGRMALTNYLSHSVITAILFNYIGLFGQWGRGKGLLLCFAIFAFQLWMSPIWLSRFRFGPMEWLWRWATYQKRPPMRREESGLA